MGKGTMEVPGDEEVDEQEQGDQPDQVAFTRGREDAQNLRRQERENQRRVRAGAKNRRQESVSQRKENKVLQDAHSGASAGEFLEAVPGGADNELEVKFAKPSRVSGLLDDSIINLLSAKEKRAPLVSSSQDVKTQKRKKIVRRKGSETGQPLSRVKVSSMGADQRSMSHNAMAFKCSRLYGDHVHRSHEMLPRPTS